MEKKLRTFLDEAFKPYGEFPAREDVIQELLANMMEKYEDLKSQGKTNDEAYQTTVDSFGDVTEIMEQVPHADAETKTTLGDDIREMLGFKAKANRGKFKYSALMKADLAGTDLKGADFTSSALMDTVFDEANLTGAKFKAAALKKSSFRGANLTAANFTSADLQNVNFSKANLTGVTLKSSALGGAIFDGATLKGTEFSGSDLSNVSFDGQTLDAVIFNSASLKNTSFKKAILRDVSFHHSAVKHAIFEGASMDKITYAILKSAKANVDSVTII
ncbi:MAG TPA: pentapeptide repeat-containing protein [Candidatus Chromulinivoraceae bacterium]|nr:pentapeptide repeat-containing protein [Candidatus Chromulinivoraceae bacterium]